MHTVFDVQLLRDAICAICTKRTTCSRLKPQLHEFWHSRLHTSKMEGSEGLLFTRHAANLQHFKDRTIRKHLLLESMVCGPELCAESSSGLLESMSRTPPYCIWTHLKGEVGDSLSTGVAVQSLNVGDRILTSWLTEPEHDSDAILLISSDWLKARGTGWRWLTQQICKGTC